MPQKKTYYKKKYNRKYKKRYNKRYRRYQKNNRYVSTIQAYPLPSKMRVKLRWTQAYVIKSSTTDSISIALRPTSFNDVDPAFGGAKYLGYDFWSTEFKRYRVLAFKYICKFSNLESSAVRVGTEVIGSVSAPNTGTTHDYTDEASNSMYGRTTILGPQQGTPEGTLSAFVKCARVWGTPEALYDTSWAGDVGSSPAANTWLRISARLLPTTATTLQYGTQVSVHITAYGYFDNVDLEEDNP